MISISTEQAKKRFKTLPEEIKAAIFSEQTAEIIGLIGKDSHLPQEKTSKMAEVAGLVLLGFLHAEDAAKEIEQSLAINSLMARSLEDSLEKKLFARYKETLEKIYSPKPDEVPAPQRISLDSVMSAKPAAPQAAPDATTPKPLDTISAASQASAIPAPKAATPPPAMPATVAPAPAPTAAPQPAKPVPAPFVMHSENQESQLVQAPRFKLESSGAPLSAFGSAGRTSTTPQPPKPAQVEIGREEKLKPVEKTSKFESAPKAIHYSSLSSPITMEGGPVNIASARPASFGNISPMPAPPTAKPAAPASPVIPAAAKPVPPQIPAAPKPSSPAPIPVKNPLAGTATPPPSFGGLIKDMVSPEKKGSSGPNLPPPLAPIK